MAVVDGHVMAVVDIVTPDSVSGTGLTFGQLQGSVEVAQVMVKT